jgi:hypothetical protein
VAAAASRLLDVPQHLRCGLCGQLLRDAVTAPCCGGHGCDGCVREHLLAHGFVCPFCGRGDVSPDALQPARELRQVRRLSGVGLGGDGAQVGGLCQAVVDFRMRAVVGGPMEEPVPAAEEPALAEAAAAAPVSEQADLSGAWTQRSGGFVLAVGHCTVRICRDPAVLPVPRRDA